MAVIKIQKRVCDCCRKEIEYSTEGTLLFQYTVRDYMGNAAAGGETKLTDLCRDCCKKLCNSIDNTIEAIQKDAYTRAILNRTIDVVFEQQQNEIEKMLNTKNPFEEVTEKFNESNEKTLIGLINDIMEKAKAAKDLIGEN